MLYDGKSGCLPGSEVRCCMYRPQETSADTSRERRRPPATPIASIHEYKVTNCLVQPALRCRPHPDSGSCGLQTRLLEVEICECSLFSGARVNIKGEVSHPIGSFFTSLMSSSLPQHQCIRPATQRPELFSQACRISPSATTQLGYSRQHKHGLTQSLLEDRNIDRNPL